MTIELPKNDDRACSLCGSSVVTAIEAAAIFCAACIEKIRCVRHPSRKLENNADADEWMAMKDFDHKKADFVVRFYCPECRAMYQKGELV